MAKFAPSNPRVIIIAGPNGAGKSTIAPRLLRGPLRVRHFVNADVIARGLSEFHSGEMAMAAGRIMLERLRELAAARESFAFETTLASRTFAPWIADLIDQGYTFQLFYLWLPTVRAAVARVHNRVLCGGHGVPQETIERRYKRGIDNFFALYRPLATRWLVYNNFDPEGPSLIASGGSGRKERVYVANQWQIFSSVAETRGNGSGN